MFNISKSVLLFAYMFMSVPCYGQTSTDAAGDLTSITLEKQVYFSSPKGDDVLVVPGNYKVHAGEESLQLIPENTKEALVITAETDMGTQEVQLPEAVAKSISGADIDEAPHHLILLILPDGRQMVAEGSYSAIRTRGLIKSPEERRRDRARRAHRRAQSAKFIRKVEQTIKEVAKKAGDKIKGGQ